MFIIMLIKKIWILEKKIIFKFHGNTYFYIFNYRGIGENEDHKNKAFSMMKSRPNFIVNWIFALFTFFSLIVFSAF